MPRFDMRKRAVCVCSSTLNVNVVYILFLHSSLSNFARSVSIFIFSFLSCARFHYHLGISGSLVPPPSSCPPILQHYSAYDQR